MLQGYKNQILRYGNLKSLKAILSVNIVKHGLAHQSVEAAGVCTVTKISKVEFWCFRKMLLVVVQSHTVLRY